MFRTLFALALLCVFLCGCGKVNDQGTNTRRDDAASVSNLPVSEAASPRAGTFAASGSMSSGTTDSTNSFEATLGLSMQTQPVTVPDSTTVPADQVSFQLLDGTVYTGEVHNGKPNGYGIVTDPNGRNQEGEWRDGKPYRVHGTVVGPADGVIEIGTWNTDGSKSGGTIIWINGQQYKGDWKVMDEAPELPDGQGEMHWPDGRKYVGQFRDGKMDGPGKMTYSDGKVEDGTWKAGKFTGPAK